MEKTLRDEIAILWTQSIINNKELMKAICQAGRADGLTNSGSIAKASYEFADEMLKQREVKND